MNKITKERLEHIAELSGLAAEEELYEEVLSMLELSRFEADAEYICLKNESSAPLRDDIVGKSLQVWQLLDGAPDKENGFFTVPGGLD